MKNNKIFIYIGILAVGVLLGWWVFGGSSNEGTDHNHDAVTETDQMWTCSMHPQIIQSEPGDCPICGMDLIFVDTESEGLAINEIRMTKNAIALANIATTIIGEESTITNGRITLSGRITINEESEAVQSSYFDGRIEKLNITYEGQTVKQGQLLATIYAPNLVAAQQELITSLSLKESQPALYKAVRNKLKLWKLTENQINKIEESCIVKENFPMYANVSGTVADKMVAEGDYVKQGQPLLKISDLSTVWAELDVYENQVSIIKKGQKLKIVSNANPNSEFDAVISFIDPILNEQTRIVNVRATIDNQKGLLKPGMFVKGIVESTSGENTDVLTIPSSAVMWTGERSVVYLKVNKDKPIYRMREVELGDRNGDMFVVNSGLQTGDEVVTKGTFTVDAAAQLQGKKSMMTQNQEKEVTSSGIGNMKLVFPDSFKMGFKSVLPSYFNIKNALVLGNATEVSEYSKNLLESIVSINESDLNNMGKLHFSRLEELLGKVASSEDLKYQRDIFIELNENMVPIVMNIGGMENPVYIQKCPMANNNKGAFWISSEKEIRNPYYGEQMMTCGSIIDTIN